MKALRPRTFLSLVLIGFIMVSLPLGVGLWTTLTFIDRVSGTGLAVVEHALDGTSNSEILAEYLRNEERSLRLFGITGENEHLLAAERYHTKIDSLLYDLLGLPLATADREKLEEMRHTRNIQRTLLIKLRNQKEKEAIAAGVDGAVASFAQQQLQARETRAGFHDMMQREITSLQQTTKEAQRALVVLTGAFIIATIILIGVMAFLLSWPIRQLNKSVERLGNGDFKTPVAVSGPLDLVAAGERLDWLRQQLNNLEQEKTKFLAHISHELKTPLASIREGASLLSEGVVGPLHGKQIEVAKILVNNSIVLQELIENIISFNMARFSDKSQKKRDVALREIIDHVVKDQAARIIGQGITLDIDTTDAVVHGDRKELETIFENLIGNAIAFTPVGGVVGCRWKTNRTAVAGIVFDSGPGIAAGEEDSIFQPFYQGKRKARSPVKGSGLGLAIVREYVKHHGGTIQVLNPGEQGARFGITLPLARRNLDRSESA